MAREFPLLTAEQIECRVQQANENKGASVLLYKTARTDYEMFDKTFGPMNWQCRYEVINGNLYCSIGVYDKDKKEWIWKQNCGTESNTEKEKGEASDALKRAGFAWGCGTELYSAPFIWIDKEKLEWSTGDKKFLKTKMTVSDIGYDGNGNINALTVIDGKGNPLYSFSKNKKAEPKKETATVTPKAETRTESPASEKPIAHCKKCGKDIFKTSEGVSTKTQSGEKVIICNECAGKLKKNGNSEG